MDAVRKPAEQRRIGRDAILDAAEETFAREGFAGAGMKAVALRAGVAQSLIHYHFASKDGLYAAVIERRARRIVAAREALLDAVDIAAPDAAARIFEAFFRPALGPEGGGAAFARVFAALAVGDARDRALVRRLYDPSAMRFVDALAEARPGARREDCAWGYTMALGLLVSALGRSGRPERLAGLPEPEGDDTERLIARLVLHAAGGFEALCASGAP